MSISTIQEKILNKGCGSVLIVVAALAMGVSLFSSQCGTGATAQEQEARSRAVALVDGVPVSGEQIQAQAEQMGSQDALGQSTALMYATGGGLRTAAIRALIAKGPQVTEAEVVKAAGQFADQMIDRAKMQLQMQGQLKPGATEADFEKALKPQLAGKTLAQFRESTISDIKTKFADPASKEGVVAAMGDSILSSRFGEKATSDDKALRDAYRTYVTKRIFFSAASGSTETPEARAAKALADLKSGKTFDSVMDKASNDAPAAGKPLHDTTESIPSEVLDRRPELSELKGKPLMTTTGVVDVPGGKAIYQLAAIQDGVPSDFETNKAKYREQKAAEAGRVEIGRQVKDLLASDAVKWQSQGYQALAAVYNATSAGPGAGNDALLKAFELAQKVSAMDNATERRLGAMAMLAASESLKQAAPNDPKTKTQRIAAMEAAQKAGIQDSAISLQLVDLYGEAKDGAKASEALIAASKGNLRYDAEGERVFREINGRALKLQGVKVLTAAQLEAVQAQQALWSNARAENEKADAAAKADMEKQRKANEAEIAKQKAEAAKSGPSKSDEATKKSNEEEIARQKAEAAKASGTKPGTPAAKPATTAGGQ